jgi:hypothetical protein
MLEFLIDIIVGGALFQNLVLSFPALEDMSMEEILQI